MGIFGQQIHVNNEKSELHQYAQPSPIRHGRSGSQKLPHLKKASVPFSTDSTETAIILPPSPKGIRSSGVSECCQCDYFDPPRQSWWFCRRKKKKEKDPSPPFLFSSSSPHHQTHPALVLAWSLLALFYARERVIPPFGIFDL